MSGRRPAKGSPFTLAEHFLTTLLVAGFLMVGVLTVAFIAQDLDPEQNVCEVDWDCGAPHQATGNHLIDTSTPQGATP